MADSKTDSPLDNPDFAQVSAAAAILGVTPKANVTTGIDFSKPPVAKVQMENKDVKTQEAKPEESKPAATEKEAEQSDNPDHDDVFGLGTKTTEKTELPEEVRKYITDKYKLDEKAFFERIENYDKVSKASEELAEFQETFKNLPPPLITAMTAALEGKDYLKVIDDVKRRPDFSIEFENQPSEKVLSFYHPETLAELKGELKDETIDDKTYGERLAKEAAKHKKSFLTDQREAKDAVRKIREQEKESHTKFTATIEETFGMLKTDLPGFKGTDKVKSILSGNRTEAESAILNIFFSKEGVKKDAAKNLAVTLNSDSLLKTARAQGETKGKTEANLNVVLKGKENPDMGKGAKRTEAELPNEIKVLAGLSFGQKKRTFSA